MCCVIPPASLACTLVLRILSRSRVLPVSTWPSTHTMGWRVGILGCFLLFFVVLISESASEVMWVLVYKCSVDVW